MNKYSKILHHISPKNPSTPKSSLGKKRTFEEYEAEQKKTEVDILKEQTQQLTDNIEFLQNLVVNQHDEVYELRQQLKNTPIPQPRKNLTEGLLNEPPNVKNSDPLTPLNQNFVTIQQLNDHYQLFINRIQQQMATIGGGGETQFKFLDDVVNFIFVGTINDLPYPVNGVINLKDNYTYFFTTTVDLEGNRLVAGQNTTILGGSSENCRIKSTGISTTTALLSSHYSLPIRNITLEAPYAINLDATGYGTQALDWFGVNFTNCAKVGIISSYNNFIMLDGAFLDSQDLSFDGTMGTVGFNQCLFSASFSPFRPAGKSILNFPSTFISTRRIRITVCSFVISSGYTGISIGNSAVIPDESFILDTCNFSGSSGRTNVSGNSADHNSNKALFTNNKSASPIKFFNSFASGQIYMKNNTTPTGITTAGEWYKIAGITTTAGVEEGNSKFIASDNRLTCDAAIERKYNLIATVSFTSTEGNYNLGKFAIYDSNVGISTFTVLTHPVSTTESAHITLTDIVELSQGDYVEVHFKNDEDTSNVLVTDLNMIITQIG
jgi:hypothetical protein